MKIYWNALFAALTMIVLTVGSNTPARSQEADADAAADENAKQVVAAIAQHLEASDFAKAVSLMTPEAGSSYIIQQVGMFTDVPKYDFLAKSDVEKAEEVIKQYKLDSIDMTKFDGSPAASKKVLAELDKLGGRYVIAKAVHLASPEMFRQSEFGGKVTGVEIANDRAKVVMEFDGTMPVLAHTLKKIDGQWKWAKISMHFAIQENLEIAGKSVAGEDVSLEDYRGKFVLVDFWGTWCGPCVAEIPANREIQEALRSRGFEILGVAVDDRTTLERFAKTTKMPWINIVDPQGKVADAHGVQAFPTTLLIDREGKHVASNLSGSGLLEELIQRMELDATEFVDLRKSVQELQNSAHAKMMSGAGKADDAESDGDAKPDGDANSQEVGFDVADADGSGAVSKKEMLSYLEQRIGDMNLPLDDIFTKLDADNDEELSTDEFEKRREVIQEVMTARGLSMMDPKDPGKDFVPFVDLTQPVDDPKVFGAVFHRHRDLPQGNKWAKATDLKNIPPSVALKLNPQTADTPSVSSLVKSSVIIAGGSGMNFFTAGAVVVSESGHAITNYHVVEALTEGRLNGMTSDGKMHPVIKVLAGDRQRDVALIQLGGSEFHPVKIASQTPAMGDSIEMLHHSELRFYTYDRGYVMRYPRIGKGTWMEISADYAPGGSGCGIFNANHELVGLVSMVTYGDGPTLGDTMDMDEIQDQERSQVEQEFQDIGQQNPTMLLVKHAVPLTAIQSLFKADSKTDSSSKEKPIKAIGKRR